MLWNAETSENLNSLIIWFDEKSIGTKVAWFLLEKIAFTHFDQNKSSLKSRKQEMKDKNLSRKWLLRWNVMEKNTHIWMWINLVFNLWIYWKMTICILRWNCTKWVTKNLWFSKFFFEPTRFWRLLRSKVARCIFRFEDAQNIGLNQNPSFHWTQN